MEEPEKEGAGQEPEGRVGTPRRHGRPRPPRDTLDDVGSAFFWGGWIGALLEIVTLRRVRRRILASRQRRVRRRIGVEGDPRGQPEGPAGRT